MLKNMRYVLVLVGLIFFTGCETLHGAATGFGQDMHNAADPSKNGWNAIQKADAWMRQNLW